MTTKSLLAVALTLAPSACADFRLARLAPPGIVKYEELESEKPPNPEIEARIAARQAARAADWPDMSAMPKEAPEGLKEVEREQAIESLEKERDGLTADVAAARLAAAEERATPLIVETVADNPAGGPR